MPRKAKPPQLLDFEHEVAELVRSMPAETTASERALATKIAFGEERAWSAAKVNAFFAWRLRARRCGRHGFFDLHPVMGAFVRDRLASRRLDGLRAELAAAFPGEPQPGRSTLHRYIQAEREAAIAAEARAQLAKKRPRGAGA